VLEPVEGHITLAAGAVLACLAVLAIVYPRVFSYPFAFVAAWLGAVLLFRGGALLRERHHRRPIPRVRRRTP
jgi:hypothetical protein